VDPFAAPPALKVERPDPDPRKEAQRLVQQGRAAFAAGEYGRAVRLFAAAAEKDPDLPFPRYWQTQAEIAAGRYAEAFAALRLGLQRHPQAGVHFDPKEPYGSQPRKYADHLAALRRAVADQPQEPTLAYLLAWQLWLAGEKAEARRWWERSQTLGGPADWLALFP
jgi:tetratricopeptide (TPR) repeat protein